MRFLLVPLEVVVVVSLPLFGGGGGALPPFGGGGCGCPCAAWFWGFWSPSPPSMVRVAVVLVRHSKTTQGSSGAQGPAKRYSWVWSEATGRDKGQERGEVWKQGQGRSRTFHHRRNAAESSRG